jgi:hypothetical protein
MALMDRKEFTRTALMYAVNDYEYVFGQEAALAALECLTKIWRDALGQKPGAHSKDPTERQTADQGYSLRKKAAQR